MKKTFVLALLLVQAACTSDEPTATERPSGNEESLTVAMTASVQMRSDNDAYGATSNSFSPNVVTIAQGGAVSWVNGTGTEHNVTFNGVGAPNSIPNFSMGSQARSFPSPGTYAYYCSIHSGMSGSVRVGS